MQSPTPHSVALAYDGSDLYFFDPNSGVHELTNLASAATELENHLTTRYAVPYCVHANMFKLNQQFNSMQTLTQLGSCFFFNMPFFAHFTDSPAIA